MGPRSYGRVAGMQISSLHDRRVRHSGSSQPVAHRRAALLWKRLEIEKRARATGRFK